MPKNAEQILLLHKIDTTEGTDVVPVVGSDAVLTRNFNVTFLDAESKERALDQFYYGARPTILAKASRRIQFEIEMASSGTAGTAAPWQTLLRSCGFGAATVVSSTSATSAPITAAIPSASLYAFYDNLRLHSIGARGNVGFVIEDDEVPYFTFDYLGRPQAALADETTPGAATLTAYKDPLIASTENTTISFGSFAAPLRRFSMDSGASLEYRSLIGPADRVLYRQRAWTGEVVMELPDLTAKNYFTNVLARSTAAMTVTHGTAAGSIVAISAPRLELGAPTLSNEQGVLMASFPVRALPSTAGNDEISIVAR
jgi:hypothetical protein